MANTSSLALPVSPSPSPDDEGVSLPVLVLVVGSAVLHACWNLAARKTKGDLAVLTWGAALAGCLLAPALPFVESTGPFEPALPYVVATGVAHIAYIVLLGLMYSHVKGSVSVVYPVARGTGVMGTAMLAGPIIGETIRPAGVVGIISIVFGVGLLGAAKMGVAGLGPVSCASRRGRAAGAGAGAAGAGAAETAAGVASSPGGLTAVVAVMPKGSSTKYAAVAANDDDDDDDDDDHDDLERATAARPVTAASGPGSDDDEQQQQQEAIRNSPAPNRSAHHRCGGCCCCCCNGGGGGGGGAQAIIFGLMCGATITTYSLVDKLGVEKMNPITYIFGMIAVELLGLVPYMLLSGPANRALCVSAVRAKKVFVAIVGIGAIGTYLIILYALSLAKASFVTALRESSVVFGAILGVVVLKEEVTKGMVLGVPCVVAGLVLIKLA